MDDDKNIDPNQEDRQEKEKSQNQVYEDSLQGPVKQFSKGLEKHAKAVGDNVGQSLTKITSAVNTGLDAIGQVCVFSYEQIREILSRAVSKKLEHTKPEDIVTPPMYVAGPAIEAFRFTQEQPELQDMFASLIASSMNKNRHSGVHPAFIEIIKQLSPYEASILKSIFIQHESEFGKKPSIAHRLLGRQVFIVGKGSRFRKNIVLNNVNHSKDELGIDHINSNYMKKFESIDMVIDNAPTTAVCLDNLLRLKLFTLTTKTNSNYILGDDNEILEMTTMLCVSEFGINFINTCVK